MKRRRSLFLKVEVLGFSGEHRLPITVKPHPRFNAKWSSDLFLNLNCIVKTGTIETLEQDTLIELRLPPGHQQDATTCDNPILGATTFHAGIGELDVFRFRYAVADLPPFLTVLSSEEMRPNPSQTLGNSQIKFAIDTHGIRDLMNKSDTTITIRSPNPNRTDTLRFVVFPNSANGFTANAACTPSPLHVGGLLNCHIRVASPAGSSGQPISWRMVNRTCFGEADPSAPYNPDDPFQHFQIPTGQTEANIPVRSDTNVSNCASAAGISHSFEAWVGNDTAATSGPGYTRTTITLVKP